MLIEDEKVVALAATGSSVARRGRPTPRSTRPGCYVVPGGVDGHTHMEMPFGGTTASDTFETGTRAAAWGGTTTIVDFAIQSDRRLAARGPRRLAREGRRQLRDRLRVPHDHGRRQRELAQGDGGARRRGRHQLQAVHGLPGRALQRRRPGAARVPEGRRDRRPDPHARRERHRHRRARSSRRSPAARPTRATTASSATSCSRPRRRTGRSSSRRSPTRPSTSCTCRRRRRSRRSRRPATRATTPSPRPARSTCSCPTTTWPGPGFEGAKYVCSTPLRPARAPGGAVARAADERPVGGVDRPLPVLLQAAEGDGARRLLEDPERAAGRRAPDGPAAPGRGRRAHLAAALDRAGLRDPGADVRALPAQGHDRAGLGRRHRRLRPDRDAGAVGVDAPHERRLLLLRGPGDHRPGPDGAVARPGRGRRRGVPGVGRATGGSCAATRASTWEAERGGSWTSDSSCRPTRPARRSWT